MITLNSISGGKTSAYIAANYPADYNVFALVTTDDKDCLYPDPKIRQMVSDKIGKEFIGTLEEDVIIQTILELEQYIGQEINWVAGLSFDKLITRGKNKYLPNKVQRFCTSLMKVEPIKVFWYANIRTPIEVRIGFRANEMNRAKSMLERCEDDGFIYDKFIVGKSKGTIRPNRWERMKYQKPNFPLITDGLYKDDIEKYWKGKPVTFAYMNNCVGCFHRNAVLLKHMSERHPNKFNWFVKQEQDVGYGKGKRLFKTDMSYQQIKDSLKQVSLFDDDFTECDSGYCGL